MPPRERFVHFVALFAPTSLRQPLLEEVMRMDPKILTEGHVDESGDYVPPPIDYPMDAAWEFVRYRMYGATRPAWFPRLVPPSTQIL